MFQHRIRRDQLTDRRSYRPDRLLPGREGQDLRGRVRPRRRVGGERRGGGGAAGGGRAAARALRGEDQGMDVKDHQK